MLRGDYTMGRVEAHMVSYEAGKKIRKLNRIFGLWDGDSEVDHDKSMHLDILTGEFGKSLVQQNPKCEIKAVTGTTYTDTLVQIFAKLEELTGRHMHTTLLFCFFFFFEESLLLLLIFRDICVCCRRYTGNGRRVYDV